MKPTQNEITMEATIILQKTNVSKKEKSGAIKPTMIRENITN